MFVQCRLQHCSCFFLGVLPTSLSLLLLPLSCVLASVTLLLLLMGYSLVSSTWLSLLLTRPTSGFLSCGTPDRMIDLIDLLPTMQSPLWLVSCGCEHVPWCGNQQIATELSHLFRMWSSSV